MTDSTAARRALLGLLLDRVDRDALLPVERPCLRALVTAEQAAADAGADLTHQLDDIRKERDGWWATAEQQGETLGRRLEAVRHAVADARARALPRSDLDQRLRPIEAALDCPLPTPDDGPTTAAVTPDEVEFVPTRSTPNDWATGIDERCPAHYIGPPPSLTEPADGQVHYRCERRPHDRTTNHATRQQAGTLLFEWTDAIAVYPTDTPET